MARSYRKPAHSWCRGGEPRKGKQRTSRMIRRKARQQLHIEKEDFDFAHPLDKNRGQAGSRDSDWGWNDFGDGRCNPYQFENILRKHHDDEDFLEWAKRLYRK